MVTVKELDLSAAELAVLTQVGESVEQESSIFQAGNQAGDSNIFSGENFTQSELQGQVQPLEASDEQLEDEENDKDEDEEEIQ